MNKNIIAALSLMIPLFNIASCGEKPSNNVTNYKLCDGVFFTGIINNSTKLPADGEGKLSYENKSTFDGDFLNGLPVEGKFVNAVEATTFEGKITSTEQYVISYTQGKLTFSNGQYYDGKFTNNLFEDEDGFFSYHKVINGQIEHSYTYQGGFHLGAVDNQTGKLIYPNFYKNQQGIWYIQGEMETTCKVKSNTRVTCKIRWPDAYYEGEAEYDGINVYSEGKGTTVFDNTCKYVGEYSNGQYHGKGTFNWPDGTMLEGNFVNGSPNGQKGTIHYPCEKTQTSGVWYFTGDMVGFVAPKPDQVGNGKIRYDDMTSYVGDIYFNNYWQRKGEGIQDFWPARFSATTTGGPKGAILDKYVGHFDEDKSGWIFGNGIMYYKDSSGNPLGWSHAYWYGLDAIEEWQGDFNRSVLLDEYKNLDELPITTKEERADHYNDMYNGINRDIMFIGDSYLEMWRREYYIVNYEGDFEKNYGSINLAIGGTTYKQWINYLFDKMATSHTASKVVIHLGTNDIHMHLGKDTTVKNCKELVNKVKSTYPNAQIYLLTTEPTTTFAWSLVIEKAYNAEIKSFYSSDEKITVVDTAALLMDGENPVSNLASYLLSDGLHMNATGYAQWVNEIKTALGLQ